MKIILITLTALLLMTTNIQASEDKLRHANPMPNLVRYVMGNAELLKLSVGQKIAIEQWSKEHKPKMKKMVKQVMMQEEKLLRESLTTDENTLAKAEDILDIRREIMKVKTLCRTHLKTILSTEQYALLLSIYKEAEYQKNEIII